MANNINISSVISPDILKTISSSTAIKTFGSQLKDQAKEKVKSIALGKAQQLKDQIEEVITLEIKVRADHGNELKRLEIILKQKQITQEQYDEAVAKENISFDKKLKDLEELKAKLEEDLKNIINDPYKKIKENANKRKLSKARRKARTKAEKAKARRDLAKKVAKNAAKTLAPIIALQITNKLSEAISQRGQLEKLVDQVNAYIDQAKTPETAAIATNLRNNTITLINNSIRKLQNIQNILKQISLYITIFQAIVSILSSIPIPTSVPPGIGIPVNVITKITRALERISKLISALNVILAVADVTLFNEVLKLNELIERLKNVNLDNLNSQQLADLTNAFLPTGNSGGNFGIYKGFSFSIKEEQNPRFVVKGNKRRYAVAINRNGVEQLKSDFSFTQDPNDLIDQLKLIIDQQNLQG